MGRISGLVVAWRIVLFLVRSLPVSSQTSPGNRPSPPPNPGSCTNQNQGTHRKNLILDFHLRFPLHSQILPYLFPDRLENLVWQLGLFSLCYVGQFGAEALGPFLGSEFYWY